MGGGLGPVWVVVLHAVQHRVSGGGFSVDHLSWERRGISIYLNPQSITTTILLLLLQQYSVVVIVLKFTSSHR